MSKLWGEKVDLNKLAQEMDPLVARAIAGELTKAEEAVRKLALHNVYLWIAFWGASATAGFAVAAGMLAYGVFDVRDAAIKEIVDDDDLREEVRVETIKKLMEQAELDANEIEKRLERIAEESDEALIVTRRRIESLVEILNRIEARIEPNPSAMTGTEGDDASTGN